MLLRQQSLDDGGAGIVKAHVKPLDMNLPEICARTTNGSASVKSGAVPLHSVMNLLLNRKECEDRTERTRYILGEGILLSDVARFTTV